MASIPSRPHTSLSLVHALDSMRREDGSPNIIKRRSELDALLGALLPDEIRRIKELMETRTFVRDFIPELPIEIRLIILNFLPDLADYRNIRYVSKTWQRVWTQVPICNKLMKHHFRAAFENTYLSLPNDKRQTYFLAATDHHQALRRGDYHSMRIVRYSEDEDEQSDPTAVLHRQYDSGRVAWAIGACITVYSLVTGTRKRYMTPDRENVGIWAMSGKVVVVVSSDSMKIHAWILDAKPGEEDLFTVRLPNMLDESFIHQDDRIGFSTIKNDIMIWKVGGPLRQMKTIDPLPNHRDFRETSLIFNPHDVNIVYIVTMACTRVDEDSPVSGNIQWIVQKYVKDILVKTVKNEFPLEGLDYHAGDEPSHNFTLALHEVDDNGTYSICELALNYASRYLDLGCHHHWDRRHRRPGHRMLTMQITFNIYTDTLSTVYYHLPPGQKHSDDVNFVIPQDSGKFQRDCAHYWSGLMMLPIIRLIQSPNLSATSPSRIPVEKALLLAVKSCDQIAGPPTKIKYIGGYGPSKRIWNCKGRFPTRDLGLQYVWVGDLHFAALGQEANQQRDFNDIYREVRGDGSFVVLFGEYDFVVWCFDRNIELPEQN